MKALWRFITRRPMRVGAYSFSDVVVHRPVNKYHDGERWVLCNNKWGFGVVVPCEPPNVLDGIEGFDLSEILNASR